MPVVAPAWGLARGITALVVARWLVLLLGGIALSSCAPLPSSMPTEEFFRFVWQNPDLSGETVVRPDGKIALPHPLPAGDLLILAGSPKTR